MKNRIVIYTGIGDEKQRKEFFNFTKIDHTYMKGQALLRLQCGSAFYYFPVATSVISEVEICEEKEQ